jgi:hypothetical protein
MDKNIKEILRLNKNYHIYEQANELDTLKQELKTAIKEIKKSLEKNSGSEIERHKNYLNSLSYKTMFVDEDNEDEVRKVLLSYIGR